MILVIGSSGLVGSRFLELIPNKKEIIAPTETELSILQQDSVKDILEKYHPEVVINFAAHTNLDEAEKQKGDKTGLPWKLNVEGAKNVAKVCQKNRIFLIHISTDAVFPGTKNFPGPYSEDTVPPDNDKDLSWYGYTKLQGEKAVIKACPSSAIVRIAYPFGNPSSERDFANKTLSYIDAGYTLFDDQIFTPTYIPDLAKALLIISKNKFKGTYHIACTKLTTPYKFGKYAALIANLNQEVKPGSVFDYFKVPGRPMRVINGGLKTKNTEKRLKIKLSTWQEALDSFTQKH